MNGGASVPLGLQMTGSGTNIAGTTSLADGKGHVVGLVRDGAGNVSIRIDGVVDASASNATDELSNLPSLTISGGWIAEAVLYAGALTSQQLGEIESYLKTRYAL